jgi:hypothetical protein
MEMFPQDLHLYWLNVKLEVKKTYPNNKTSFAYAYWPKLGFFWQYLLTWLKLIFDI